MQQIQIENKDKATGPTSHRNLVLITNLHRQGWIIISFTVGTFYSKHNLCGASCHSFWLMNNKSVKRFYLSLYIQVFSRIFTNKVDRNPLTAGLHLKTLRCSPTSGGHMLWPPCLCNSHDLLQAPNL